MTEVIQGGVEYPATPHFQPPPELPPGEHVVLVPGGFRGLQKIQGASKDFRGLQRSSGGFRGLQWASEVSRGLQRTSEVSRGLQTSPGGF